MVHSVHDALTVEHIQITEIIYASYRALVGLEAICYQCTNTKSLCQCVPYHVSRLEKYASRLEDQ